MDPFLFIVDVLAVYRLTRLIVRDSLLDRVRWWILNRWPTADTTFPDNLVVERRRSDTGWVGKLATGIDVWLSTKTDSDGDPLWEADRTYKLSELVECGWCASLHVAVIVILLRTLLPGPWNYVAVALAFSALAGLIITRLED